MFFFFGAVVIALASHQCGAGLILAWCDMWVEFVVDSRPCSQCFSPGFPEKNFPRSTKTNKFQFDLQCYMVIAGDVKQPTHSSQRVGNVVPGVVV